MRCHSCERAANGSRLSLLRAGWEEPVYVPYVKGGWLITSYCPRHARWWRVRYWARRFQWRVGTVSKTWFPHLGTCNRCQTSWGVIEGHTTDYGYQGCFPLCEGCWADLATPTARLPFYRKLWASWVHEERDYAFSTPESLANVRDKWTLIRRAVMEGK